MKPAAQDRQTAVLAPSINSIRTMTDLRNWEALKEEANVAKVPLAKRATIPTSAMPVLLGFDMGPFAYDPWFTLWSQGAHGADSTRSAANVYNFSWWQYADISYYFDHRLVTVPPTVWTNAAHKNGVLSLGTVALNWSENNGLFTEEEVADFLTPAPVNPDKQKIYLEDAIKLLKEIQDYYGFDGYIFNLEFRLDEKKYPPDQLRLGMKKILSTLKSSGCKTLWYDAPFSNDQETWANYLNPAQFDFFEAANYFQTNYWWGPWLGGKFKFITPASSWNTLTQEDKANALSNRNFVFSGIYASTDPANNGSPPYKGTFFPAISLIKSNNTNPDNPPDYFTGLNVYYPAWTYFDFRTGPNKDVAPDRALFRNNDQAFWAGTKDFLDYPNPGKNPITAEQCMSHYLFERTAICSVPFVTSFNDGEGDFYNIAGQRKSTGPWNNLSDQNILPSFRFTFDGVAKKESQTRIYHDDPKFVWEGGSSLFVDTQSGQTQILDLFRTNIKLTKTTTIRLVVKDTSDGVVAHPLLWITFGSVVTLDNPKVTDMNGWKGCEYAIPEDLDGEVVNKIQLRLTANTITSYLIGQFAIRDSAIKFPPLLLKDFPGDSTELDWSDEYEPSSHYRVYGVNRVDGFYYLIGVVYNSVYRAQYPTQPNLTQADHIFNTTLNDFVSYRVQEVNVDGQFLPF